LNKYYTNSTNEELIQHNTLKSDSIVTKTKLLTLVFYNIWVITSIIIIGVISITYYELYSDKIFIENGYHTLFNKYMTFNKASESLINSVSLYSKHPDNHFDFYKSSPSFALFFSIFNLIPYNVGLFIWNILNSVLIIGVVHNMSKLGYGLRNKFLWILAIEILTMALNEESYGLFLGLLFLAYWQLENGNTGKGAIILSSLMFVKFIGIFFLLLLFIYPNKIRSLATSLLTLMSIALLPLIIVNPDYLYEQYVQWFSLLFRDSNGFVNLSAMNIFESWFDVYANKFIFISIAFALMIIPLIGVRNYSSKLFRLFFISSILVFVSIFNLKSDHSTFVLSTFGICIWYFYNRERERFLSFVDYFLFLGMIIFSIIISNEILMQYVLFDFSFPMYAESIPCFLIWIKLSYDLCFFKEQEEIKYRIIDTNLVKFFNQKNERNY